MDEFSSRRQISDGHQEHIFHQEIAGYGPLQSSHQGVHQEIAVYSVGYEPLQSSHPEDHHEIAGYGPLLSSHQGDRLPIDQ